MLYRTVSELFYSVQKMDSRHKQNGLPCGLTACLTKKVYAVNIDTNESKSKLKSLSCNPAILAALHWLPLSLKINFKMLLFFCVKPWVFWLLPMCDLLTPYKPNCCLRSSGRALPLAPKSYIVTKGDQAFAVQAPLKTVFFQQVSFQNSLLQGFFFTNGIYWYSFFISVIS